MCGSYWGAVRKTKNDKEYAKRVHVHLQTTSKNDEMLFDTLHDIDNAIFEVSFSIDLDE